MVFVGTQGGMERPMIEKSGVSFRAYHEVSAGPLHGVGVLKALQSVVKLVRGTLSALAILHQHRPDVVLNTGGWAAVPVSVAAWLMRVPVVVYLPDIEPGLTIRATTPIARKVAATTDQSAAYVPAHKLAVTGYPLRRALKQATRAEGIAHFGLDPAKRTLLVFGGSRGARSLNVAVTENLASLLAGGDLQILHVTGDLDAERGAAAKGTPDYHPFAYLHGDMGLALAAADLCLCRSGASTLGELPFFGLPGLLVPYPHAWRYQKVNADYLAERGAGVVLRDEALATDLVPTVRALLDDPARLGQMRAAARALSHDAAAESIVGLLRQVCHAGGTRS